MVGIGTDSRLASCDARRNGHVDVTRPNDEGGWPPAYRDSDQMVQSEN